MRTRKQESTICYLEETHFNTKTQLKGRNRGGESSAELTPTRRMLQGLRHHQIKPPQHGEGRGAEDRAGKRQRSTGLVRGREPFPPDVVTVDKHVTFCQTPCTAQHKQQTLHSREAS